MHGQQNIKMCWSRTAINRPLTGKNRRGIGRCVD